MKNDIHLYETSYWVSPIPSTGCSKVRSPDSFTKNVFDFATTEMLIPEGSEHLFKDIYTAKADELYHHVLDKFGWAWRDPKYKSETELCAMLKWVKEKGLTIEELSI